MHAAAARRIARTPFLAALAALLGTALALIPAEVPAAGGHARRPVAGTNIVGLGFGEQPGVLAWGSSGGGTLGPAFPSGTTHQSVLVPLAGFPRSVAFGHNHGIAALDNGAVQVWGQADLYTGSETAAGPNAEVRTLHYKLFRDARQVAAGVQTSFVLTQSGDVFALGYGQSGQTGAGLVNSPIPRRVPITAPVVSIEARCDNGAAIDEQARLWTWGTSVSMTGSGSIVGPVSPGIVLNDVAQVAMGCHFMLALLRNGLVYSWGLNDDGQLGLGHQQSRNTPTLVNIADVVSVGAGYTHAFAVLKDGSLRAWGRNAEGQLGLGAAGGPVLSPVTITGVTRAVAATGGALHSVVALHGGEDDVEFWTAGANNSGQLGPGSTFGTGSASFIQTNRGVTSTTVRRSGVRIATGSDLVWSHSATGQFGYWRMTAIPSSNYWPLRNTEAGWKVIGTGDINFDDVTEVFLYRPASGEVYFWSPQGTYGSGSTSYLADEGPVGVVAPDTGWRPQQVGDMDGDGAADIVWRNAASGAVAIWYLGARGRVLQDSVFAPVGLGWSIVKTGDFDGNGVDDLLWHNASTGQVYVWLFSVARDRYRELPAGSAAPEWKPQVVSDFDGDGRSDIFWRNTVTGQTYIWYMAGNTYAGLSGPTVADTQWNAVAVASTDIDTPQSAIIWRHANGHVWYWRLDNRPAGGSFTFHDEGDLGPVPLDWQIGQ